jgi:hypothetical protein
MAWCKGQSAWLVEQERNVSGGADRYRITQVIITSVGRKWVNTMDERGFHERFDPADRNEIDYGEHRIGSGWAFPTAEEAQERVQVLSLWEALRRKVREAWNPPEGLQSGPVKALLDHLEQCT